MFNIFKSFLLIIFLFFVLISKSYSETLKISFVDMDKIIAVSTAGKKVQKSINSLIKKEEEKFKKKEADLKKKEEEILKQKNIISKDELDKKIKEFIIDPKTLGINCKDKESLKGKNAEYNSEKITEIFKGKKNEFSQSVALNVAAGLIVSGKETDFKTAFEIATKHLNSGNVF